MINCIIICAGEATRWGNHLGIPKHLIEIGGETLIERTTRLLHKHKKEDIDVKIVVKDLKDKRYYVDGAETVEANLNPQNVDADKFLSSEHLWNQEGRTLVIYGDCWLSDGCIKKVMEFESEEWTLFANKVECFVQSFYPQSIPQHKAALEYIRESYKRGDISVCGGWHHYRAMQGYPLTEHRMEHNFYLIDDLSDDFDFPNEYDNFMERYNNAEASLRL